MNPIATAAAPCRDAAPSPMQHAERLRAKVERAAHLLPAQGPITAFVHHNTLHAFEDQQFHEAVTLGARTFGCHPYLPEDRYREELARGRIRPEDIEAALIEDLDDQGDELLGFFGTRFQLRMAMLVHPLRTGPAAELRWIVAETEALAAFRSETPPSIRDQLVAGTRHWVMRDLRNGSSGNDRARMALDRVFERFDKESIESWRDDVWESFTLHTLWLACCDGASRCGVTDEQRSLGPRHRDLLLEASGQDADRLVHDALIRLCAAFIDQGFSGWPLPDRESGFYQGFLRLYDQPLGPPDRWMRGLRREANRLGREGITPLASLEESLHLLGVDEKSEEEFIARTLLALRGYAGMIRQLETRGDRATRSAPTGSLLEFLAVRLILDRFALEYVAKEALGYAEPLANLSNRLRDALPKHPTVSVDQRAFELFQLTQLTGWAPSHLCQMSDKEWRLLVSEMEAFSGMHRRRVYHQAYERRYRLQALDAVASHCRRLQVMNGGLNGNQSSAAGRRPSFQMICCLDDREESFRRHLEEIDPTCETFGAAGFFAVAMYYRGAAEARFTPLCPVIVKPQHYVTEAPVVSFEKAGRQRSNRRRIIGTVTHRGHVGSRTFTGGWIAAVMGSLASIPLVLRIVFPRGSVQIQKIFGALALPPVVTKLHLERTEGEPGPEPGHIGYTVAEMAVIVERLLRDIGLTSGYSRLVLLCGHGSSSLNNPHESAYNCGACAGARGGPNARAFAHMANDPRVRELLAKQGLAIPSTTYFVGAYHNTCDDSVEFYDLERLPSTHAEDFRRVRDTVDAARGRNAHERCRRFYSAPFRLSDAEALKHVEGRANDLSQARPEYNHATNALCFVGRRRWSRGLFLDRRAFLHSYDPAQDDEDCTILTRILQAVIPVCAGISLEYYFSCVDSAGWGAGNKLPHNVTSLLGVMDGAGSDLRPGLYRQMIEIHEPMRLLFVIETTPEAMLKIIDRNEGIARLVRGEWVQLATLDPASSALSLFRCGEFAVYRPTGEELPWKPTSLDWYRGWRENLDFATITASDEPNRNASRSPRQEGAD